MFSPSRVSLPTPDAAFGGLRFAAVVDEFTAASIAPEVELLNLHQRWWPIELARFRPDLVLVESAWRGFRDSWKGRIASYPKRTPSRSLAALKLACRAAKIPTVFWNKEDPVHYDRFIAAARGFDFVCTTAIEKLEDYQRDLGISSDRVIALPFAVQPRIYSRADQPRDERTIFAGSFGESHFPQRRQQLEFLLDGAILTGGPLDIFDRTADQPDPDKAFPARFAPYIRGARDYRALAEEYRSARVGLNVNSVTDSETMFSRRVFEMLACGLAVVSGPSQGIETLFPDAVAVVNSVEEAAHAIANPPPPVELEAFLAKHSIGARFGPLLERVLN